MNLQLWLWAKLELPVLLVVCRDLTPISGSCVRSPSKAYITVTVITMPTNVSLQHSQCLLWRLSVPKTWPTTSFLTGMQTVPLLESTKNSGVSSREGSVNKHI